MDDRAGQGGGVAGQPAQGRRTFACPCCGAIYPFIEKLLGRAVRCSQCSGVFQVEQDGRVLIAKPGTTRLEVGAAKPRVEDPAARTRTERIRKMRATLTLATREAISWLDTADVGPDEPDPGMAPASRALEAKRAPPAKREGRTKREVVRSVVLTGQGMREASESRRWSRVLLALAAVVVVAIAASALVVGESPEREALRRYVAEVGDAQIAYPHRHRVYQDRGWLVSRDGVAPVPVVLDCDRAQLGEARVFDWSMVRDIHERHLAVRKRSDVLALWALPEDLPRVAATWDEVGATGERFRLLEVLAKRGVDVLSYEALPRRLRAQGTDPLLVWAISTLLVGTDRDGRSREDLLALEDAEAIELRWFSGEDGTVLDWQGRAYRVETGAKYVGVLMRIVGSERCDPSWRILDMRLESSIDEILAEGRDPLTLVAERAARALMRQRRQVAPQDAESTPVEPVERDPDGDRAALLVMHR